MMKKFVATILSAAALASSAAFALENDAKFYAGVEGVVGRAKSASTVTLSNNTTLTNTTANTSGKNKSILNNASRGVNLFLGTRIENFGLEAGYSFLNTQKKDVQTTSSPALTGQLRSKNRNVYIDALGYYATNEEVDLIASIGVGRLHSKVSSTVSSNVTDTKSFAKLGVRVGAGAQFKFNENLFGRTLVTFQKGNQLIKSNVVARLGIGYQF
ncbi:MAG: hypothetical protein JWM09_1049 [Francisellaceae bacterium]|nr:hypothetical protein [Francisellaceae bacterium]